jgi:hypothetical protein
MLTSCSLYTFSQLIEVKEIIVVCDPSYKDVFEGFISPLSLSLTHTHNLSSSVFKLFQIFPDLVIPGEIFLSSPALL